MKKLLLGLLLVPSLAQAQTARYENPYDGRMMGCFFHQLRAGEWPNTMVSRSRLIVACPKIVDAEFDYCLKNSPEPGDCTAIVQHSAYFLILAYTSPDTHKFFGSIYTDSKFPDEGD